MPSEQWLPCVLFPEPPHVCFNHLAADGRPVKLGAMPLASAAAPRPPWHAAAGFAALHVGAVLYCVRAPFHGLLSGTHVGRKPPLNMWPPPPYGIAMAMVVWLEGRALLLIKEHVWKLAIAPLLCGLYAPGSVREQHCWMRAKNKRKSSKCKVENTYADGHRSNGRCEESTDATMRAVRTQKDVLGERAACCADGREVHSCSRDAAPTKAQNKALHMILLNR
jgi:hypothetical protein